MTMSFVKKIKSKSGAYAIEVQGYRDENGKVKHRYVRYLGKLDDKGNVIPSMRIENTEVEDVKLYGPVHVLHKVTQDVGLEFILGEYAPEVLTLVYSHILRPESLNNIKRALKWISTDEIGLELPVSRKRFEHAMDDLAKRTPYIERELYPKISDACDLGSLFYDISSIYFYGKNVKVAKRGHGSNRPQIGIGLAVEAQYGIPLFHHIFDGNVFDAKTFPVILGRFNECAREPGILVFDRGVANKKNVRNAINSGFSVIACIPLKGTILKGIASKEMHAMTPKDACKLSSVFIHAREVQHEWAGLPVRMIVCLNKPLREQIQQNRYYELEEALDKLGRNAKIKEGLKKYIKVDKIPEIDYDAVEESETFDGVSIIITNTNIPKEIVVKKYFDKDIIEKSFQSLKSTLSIQPARHWLWRRVKAHIFICYLAYLHVSWMKMLLEKTNVSLSPIKVLEQLETIYNVKLTDKKTGMSTTKTVPLTEEQERIYRALNLLS